MQNRNETENFLLNLSRRLSSRNDCKGVEYQVEILTNGAGTVTAIVVEPCVMGYPNKYERHEWDYQPLIYLITRNSKLNTQMSQVKYDNNSMSIYLPNVQNLIPGKYKYIKSIYGKQRKWMKLF